MINRTLSAAFASGILYFVMTGASTAQVALSSCDPATGLTPSGAQCVTLTPVDPTRYDTQISASNYNPVNVGELAETYQCDRSSGDNNAYSGNGSILIEDCGAPIDLDPSTFKEFVGYSGNTPAPAPLPAAPAPAPLPTPTVIAAPAYAPVTLAPTGLGFGQLAAGLAGVAAVGAIIALASDDNDSTVSTPGTR